MPNYPPPPPPPPPHTCNHACNWTKGQPEFVHSGNDSPPVYQNCSPLISRFRYCKKYGLLMSLLFLLYTLDVLRGPMKYPKMQAWVGNLFLAFVQLHFLWICRDCAYIVYLYLSNRDLTGTFQLSGSGCRRNSSGCATSAGRARPGGRTLSTGTQAFPPAEDHTKDDIWNRCYSLCLFVIWKDVLRDHRAKMLQMRAQRHKVKVGVFNIPSLPDNNKSPFFNYCLV